MLTIELVAHMDAGDRTAWQDDQDTRPLSELGRRQSQRLCEAIALEPVDALFSSPALRCLQTIEPVAERFRLTIKTLPNLRDTNGFAPPQGWAGRMLPSDDPVGGSYAAGRLARAMLEVSEQRSQGRVVVCTHGDTLPVFGAFLVGAHALELPPLARQRGSWYTIRLAADGSVTARLNSVPDFPA